MAASGITIKAFDALIAPSSVREQVRAAGIKLADGMRSRQSA